MGKILEFANNPQGDALRYRTSQQYRDALRDLDALLEGHAQELTTMALNLAAAGGWKTWDAGRPEGSVLELDPDDLKQTGDELVRRVMELCDRMAELRANTGGVQ